MVLRECHSLTKSRCPRLLGLLTCFCVAAAVDCADPIVPPPTVGAPLYPNAVGTQWTYVLRDTHISGVPQPPSFFRHTVRHRADTAALGSQWIALELGGVVFGIPGQDVMIRDDSWGLFRYEPGLFTLPPRERALLPSRLGESSSLWTLASMADTVETPAGMQVALRYVGRVFVDGFPPEVMWVVPGTGVVRVLQHLTIVTDGSGRETRSRFILELESIVRP